MRVASLLPPSLPRSLPPHSPPSLTPSLPTPLPPSLPPSPPPPSHFPPPSFPPSLPPPPSLPCSLPHSLYLDPLSLNKPSYTVLTPPEALNLSATVNFDVIQSVVWKRDGQVVNSVDNSVGVFARLSTADLFGNYTVTAISHQGVVYEEWALVAAYGMHEHYICTYIPTCCGTLLLIQYVRMYMYVYCDFPSKFPYTGCQFIWRIV